MLARLGQSLPTLTRRARYGLIATAMIALVLPSLSERAGGNVPTPAQSKTDSVPKVDGDQQALEEFLQTYRLAPGQDVKRIEPPRPAGSNVWWRRTYRDQPNHLSQFDAITFCWRDPDHLVWSTMSSAAWTVRDLPRYLNVDVYPTAIEGDSELMRTVVAGDWVFRERVSDEQMVAALESILQRVVRLRIKLTLRTVERDVVVVRGRYHHVPLPGRQKNEIDIYGKQLVNDEDAGGGNGRFSGFLRQVGAWIGLPVINEVEGPPTDVIWHNPSTAQTQRGDRDEALVLQHLHEQTGLTFTREKKPIRVLFVERPK
jgi:hypothetical protein